MGEVIVKQATCENCGADVRENTIFCYSCGKKFQDAATRHDGVGSAAITDEGKLAIDDLAARLKNDDAEREDKLALAAAVRKRARVTPKKAKEVIWKTEETRTGLMFFLVSLFIFIMVAVIVFITVYWK